MAKGDNEIGVTPEQEFKAPVVTSEHANYAYANFKVEYPPVEPPPGNPADIIPHSPTAAHPDYEVLGNLAVGPGYGSGKVLGEGHGLTTTHSVSTVFGPKDTGDPVDEPIEEEKAARASVEYSAENPPVEDAVVDTPGQELLEGEGGVYEIPPIRPMDADPVMEAPKGKRRKVKGSES